MQYTKFGKYGGQFTPEVLMPALDELAHAYKKFSHSPAFQKKLGRYLSDFAGRPTPLYFAERLSSKLGFRVYLKREDLLHGGAHKINNTIGQALIAKMTGKKRLIAETGAGQHGTATAMAGATLGLETVIYMGAKDIERQSANVQRMKALGAEVVPVKSGSQTLKDAINEAIRDWVANVESTHYLLGSVVGPYPYPSMVRDFQSVIGKEARKQILEKERRLPDSIIACVGGGSNAMGIFSAFLDDDVKLFGVEAGGSGLKQTNEVAFHSASLLAGTDGILHGARTKILQNKYGQILETHSIAPGLDYAGVGPQLAFLSETKRIKTRVVSDKEALAAFNELCRKEGIIPALESSHALALLSKAKRELGDPVIVNLSGRGDKDLASISVMVK